MKNPKKHNTPLEKDAPLSRLVERQSLEIETLQNKVKTTQEEIFRLKKVLDTVPGNIYYKNKNGVYYGQNKFADDQLALLNLHSGSVEGKTDYDFFPKEVADEYRKNDLYVMQQEKTLTKEETVILPSGKKMVQLSKKNPFYDSEGKVCGIVGNTVDITYLKEIENELRQAKEKIEVLDKLKTEFIRNMEHDIRTPFSGILSVANYLTDQEKNSDKKSLLLEIAQASEELLDYCNGILDFSYIESGSLPIVHRKFNLKEIIDNTIKMGMPAAKIKNLQLQTDYDTNLSTHIISDEKRIARILLNLISNAIKFTEKGSVKISTRKIKMLNGRKEIIQLTVKDTGIGIPKNQQSVIFEKFARGTPANQGQHHGTGLGLFIVKRFVEDLEGDLDLHSTTKQGSTFSITLPVQAPLIS